MQNSFVEGHLQFVSVEGRVALEFAGKCGVIVAQGEECREPLFLKEGESFVGGNAVNPGLELGFFPEGWKFLTDF